MFLALLGRAHHFTPGAFSITGEWARSGLQGPQRLQVSSRKGMPKGGSQRNLVWRLMPLPGITPHWEIRPYGAVSERHPLHGWIMHNHATLLLPVTCDLRSVVRKVGRSSRSSNSSMPSKGNKHPADFPYSWMVLYAFFFVHCMFWSFFDRCHGSTCLWWCGHGKESFRLRHLCNLADIEINRLSEPDSTASAFVQTAPRLLIHMPTL